MFPKKRPPDETLTVGSNVQSECRGIAFDFPIKGSVLGIARIQWIIPELGVRKYCFGCAGDVLVYLA